MECPCGSGNKYEACCSLIISGNQTATTAEQLMRSRYTAYTCLDVKYLLSTWHVSTRPPELVLDAESKPQWLGLKIVNCTDGQPGNSSGTVEFIARYRINGRAQRLHEVSRFSQENGRWYYLDGKFD
jgi:SEC-C motif-containing protein